jgi:RNA polymerase sigma-70 factor, ECF subfamily
MVERLFRARQMWGWLAVSTPASSAVNSGRGQPLRRHQPLKHGAIEATIMDDSKKDSGKGRTHSDSMTKNTLRTAEKTPSPTPSQPLTAEARPVQQQQRRNPPIAGELAAIASAQQGDGASFEILYNMHKRRVYSLCLRMLGNVAEAEDLTQEAFLQLHRKISTFRGDSAFSTWLHRMAVNVVLMHLRKKGLPLVSLEETLEPSQEDGPRKDFGTRDLTLSGSIDRVTLERAVEELPPGYRMVFVLHDVEGYEHNEIAGMLQCSIGNSKSQLHKARMRLRNLLRQDTNGKVDA